MGKLSVVMNAYAKEHGYFYIDQGTSSKNNPEAHSGTTCDCRFGQIQTER